MEGIIEAASELDSSTVEIEKSQSDIAEEEKLTKFLEEQCCNRNCHTQLSREEISEHRDKCAQLTKTELDMAIMGKLSVLLHRDAQAGGTNKTTHHRKQTRTLFSHHNKPICRDTFNFIHGISASRFKNLKGHYITHGLTPRTHGNKTSPKTCSNN